MLRSIKREPIQSRHRTNVIIVMGQSNVVGSATLDGVGLINDTSNDAEIGIQEYTDLATGGATYSSNGRKTFKSWIGGFGPERGMARRLTDFGCKHVEVIKTAFNGSAVSSWVPGGDFEGVANNFIAQSMGVLGGFSDPRILCYCWMQGTADEAGLSVATGYKDALESVIVSYSALHGAAPWIIGRCPSWHPFEYKELVRTAQMELGDMYGAWVDSDDTEPRSDNVHLTSAGKELVGFRMADAWMRKRA